MRGEFQHNIDSKGRMIFPVKLREDLGDKFVVFKGLDNCLWVYSMADWDAFEAKIAALPTAKARQLMRFYSSNVVCEPDAQGRILIPQVLRDYAGLTKDITVAGMMNRAEIWDTEQWKKYNDSLNSEDIAGMMEALGV